METCNLEMSDFNSKVKKKIGNAIFVSANISGSKKTGDFMILKIAKFFAKKWFLSISYFLFLFLHGKITK